MSDVWYYEKLIIFKRNNKQFVPWNKSQKYKSFIFHALFRKQINSEITGKEVILK